MSAAKFYAVEVLLALEYLHANNIVYRDLKPENILLDYAGHVKLVDFGFAKLISAGDQVWTLCGTPAYIAPEVLQGKGYSKAVDCYALGILIFEMIAGHPPFDNTTDVKMYEEILEGNIRFPAIFDPVAKDIILRLCEKDPTRRLGNLHDGIEGIKRHPWFAAVDWQKILSRATRTPHIPTKQHGGDPRNFEFYPEERDMYLYGQECGSDEYMDLFKDF